MSWNKIALRLAASFFAVGFLVLLDQYLRIGVWFQLRDIHHETLALSAFALAIGILIGSKYTGKKAD
jgi:hypothetical protein